jgi:hypothetical protein
VEAARGDPGLDSRLSIEETVEATREDLGLDTRLSVEVTEDGESRQFLPLSRVPGMTMREQLKKRKQ